MRGFFVGATTCPVCGTGSNRGPLRPKAKCAELIE